MARYPRSMTMLSSTRRRAPKTLREHACAGGFSWSVKLPERGAALGARKPMAQVLVGDGESIAIPVAVARALNASDSPEPESRAELFYRIREAADVCAWARLVDLASRREHSCAEVLGRLRDAGYTPECAERAVERGRDKRILNDMRFADSFARSKAACGWGPLRIERELRNRGVEPSEMPGWPDEYLGEDPAQERALELLRRKRMPEKNAYAKFVRFLASRGYSLAVAKDAARARIDEGQRD